jgi:histidyl-tRNA synthetase
MSEKRQFRAIKGTRDILPPDSALWNWFEQAAREVFESYNFREIRLPVFEETELFARSIGADTDVVHKEMYRIESGVEIARRMLEGETKWPFFVRDSSEYRRFTTVVSMFLVLSKAALQAGEISASDENTSIIRRLDEIFQIALELDPAREPKKESERQAIRGDVAKLAKQFDSQSISLRPEATAGSVRTYIEHGMHTLPGNQKLYYVGPMFRRERPQKGRYRQFYQIGAEVLGQSDAPAIDAEVIEMLLDFFHRVGLTRTMLYVNSIGCKECRRKYVERLREELRKVKDKLKEDSQRRIETNPLRVLDSKLPEEQPVIENLPRISEYLCAACSQHFAKLKEELKLREIAYEENWRLVRGLDYYTRTTFEVTAAGLGSQNAVCGGGRYDGLVELLGGPAGIKGIGFAIGSDRAILSIQEGGNLPKLPGLAVFIAWMGARAYPAAVSIAKKLRACGLAVELPPEEMKFKKSLGLADKLGARYALIIGEDEVASGNYTLKRLADAEQKKLNESDLLEYLQSERRGTRA